MDAARAPRTAGIVAVALALVGFGGLCRSCLGGSDPHCPAGVPDVWTVSTRGLPGICRLPDAVNFRIERLRGDGSAWERSDLPSMLDDSQQPVMVFIHGNRYGHGEARQQGLDLARRAEACGVPGLRTIVYSWPSEQQGILLNDGRAKYDRAFAEGRYLAWLLGRLDPGRPVAIVGYSFGAIITLEALEDLAVAEQTAVPGWHPWSGRPAPVNVVFIAPAIRCDAIAPRGPYRETVGSIDRLTLLTNPIDDALKYFHLIDRSLRADALGYVGMPRSWVPASMEFSCVDASNIVGRTHGFPHYLASPTLMRRICAGATTGLAAPVE